MRGKREAHVPQKTAVSSIAPRELLPLAASDEDVSDEEKELSQYSHLLKQYKIQEFKDDLASDLEYSDEGSEDDVKTDWGSRRDTFYGSEGEDELVSGTPGARIEQVEAEEEAAAMEHAEIERLRRRLYGGQQHSLLSVALGDNHLNTDVKMPEQEDESASEIEDQSVVVGGLRPYRSPSDSRDLENYLTENYPDVSAARSELSSLSSTRSHWWGKDDSSLSELVFIDKWYTVLLTAYLGLRETSVNLHNHPIINSVRQIKQIRENLQKESQRKIVAKVKMKNNKSQQVSDKMECLESVAEEAVAVQRLAAAGTEIAEESVDEDGSRPASYEILKNKEVGSAHRRAKKRDRNPRVKARYKFKKALKKRKSQVPQQRSQHRPYSGEASGIRAGIIKSRKLKV